MKQSDPRIGWSGGRTSRRKFLSAGLGSLLAGLWSVRPATAASSDCQVTAGEASRQTGLVIRLPASYYQQFDADYNLDVPAEGYGGWRRGQVELSWDHTALVVMHAWHPRSRKEYPGWYRAVEYLPRAKRICEGVFPRLLGAVRRTGFRLLHVAGGGDYYKRYPGYRRALELAGPDRAPEQIQADAALQSLRGFRDEHVFVGRHNQGDVERAFENLDFAPQARPVGEEGIAENGRQLFALCKHYGINHLIYAGFAVNWCLLMSPGGMVDMARHGLMCSVLREAVTAVENRETARRELNKELALWRVALAFGFVFGVDDFVEALEAAAR